MASLPGSTISREMRTGVSGGMRRSILPAGVQLAVLLFLGFVGLNFCLGAFDYYKARQSGDWPQVDGRVVRSGAVAGCRRGGSFAPEVRYTYSGGGRTHTGNRWRFGSAPVSTVYLYGEAVSMMTPALESLTPGERALVMGEGILDWLGWPGAG